MKLNRELKSLAGIGYEIIGSGSCTVVLLRGLGRWSEHWMGFEGVIAARGYRVIVVDNRGFGRSRDARISRKARIHDMAEDIAQIIALEAPGGVDIVGVSLGGMIAIALAAFKPSLVRNLIIVNSSLKGSGRTRLTPKAMGAICSCIGGLKDSYLKLANVLLGDSTPDDKKKTLAQAWSEIDRRLLPKIKNFLYQLMAAGRFNGHVEMAAISSPTLIVKSAGDHFVDPSNSDYIHQHIKNSIMAVHPVAGHELAFDDPDWLALQIFKQLEASR